MMAGPNPMPVRSVTHMPRLTRTESQSRMERIRTALAAPHRRRAALVALLATELAIAARLFGL
jgi:hypothetical protein